MSTDYGRHPLVFSDSHCTVCGLPIVVRRSKRAMHLCPTHLHEDVRARYTATNAAKSKAKPSELDTRGCGEPDK